MSAAPQLKLYISGRAPASIAAVSNLRRAIGADRLDDVAIIDVLQVPKRAVADRILVIPTLLRILPGDVAMMVGDLHDADALLQFVGVV